MKTNLILTLSVVFALLQGPFLPPVFFEGLLLVLILSSISNKAVLQIFLSGIIFDLVQSTQLGATSIIFVATGLLVYFLRNTISFQRPNLAAALAFAVVAIRGKILFSNFFFIEALLSVALVFLFVKYILRPIGDNRLEIR